MKKRKEEVKINRRNFLLMASLFIFAIIFILFFSSISQDEQLRWNHSNFSYAFSKSYDCPDIQKSRIRMAFVEIEEKVDKVVKFTEIDSEEDSDFLIKCPRNSLGMSLLLTADSTLEIEGEEIKKVQINLTSGDTKGITAFCEDYPNVEIHEILHGLGFVHSKDKNSVMYSHQLESNCENLYIDDEIIEKIIETYGK